MNILKGIAPEKVFEFFEKICSVPHGSGNTGLLSEYIESFAKERGLKYIRDEHDNVIIWKDASKGYENSEPVILQGHIDMVCEKEYDTDIDFEKDPLKLCVENGMIFADGTTLGGDDGIGIAYMLAILDSCSIPHPLLEAVFTSDEEIGMLGAAAMDMSLLNGRKLINLDSEDEGYILVSCAGGVTAKAVLPVNRSEKSGTRLKISVGGLLGGHSGAEIDKGRANANTLLGRALYSLSRSFDYVLESISGGMKDNAIPREAKAVIIAGKKDTALIISAIELLFEKLKNEYKTTDPDVFIKAEEDSSKSPLLPMDPESTKRVVTELLGLPGGIQRMSFDIKGLVQTSLNLGILETNKDEVSFSFAVRSSIESEKEALAEKISSLTSALGGYVKESGAYPAWEYKKDSPLRDICVAVFEKQYGRKPVVHAIHAGVECGLFSGKLPGLDAISIGPDMKDIHTPKEALSIESVKRTWELLLEMLRSLK